MKLQIGSQAPSFAAPDQGGQLHTLDQYKQQYLLLYFYPKDETPGCTTEACSFRDNFELLTPHLTVLGVSADTVESHQHFAEKHKLPFPLLSDPDEVMIKEYDVKGLTGTKRVSFLIDPQGKIVKIYDQVDPQTHPQQVLTDVIEIKKAASI